MWPMWLCHRYWIKFIFVSEEWIQTLIWSTYSALKINLNRHMKIHLREFQCDLCDYNTYSQPILDAHVRKVHTMERPFKCDQCDFAASSKHTLKNHKVVHVTERKYICSTCSKSFKRAGKCYSKVLYLEISQRFYRPGGCENFRPRSCFFSFWSTMVHSLWITFMKVNWSVMNLVILVSGHTLVNTAINDFTPSSSWLNISDSILEKNHTNVTNVTMHVRWEEIWQNTRKINITHKLCDITKHLQMIIHCFWTW